MHLALHALLENLDRAADMVFAKRNNMWLDWLLHIWYFCEKL